MGPDVLIHRIQAETTEMPFCMDREAMTAEWREESVPSLLRHSWKSIWLHTFYKTKHHSLKASSVKPRPRRTGRERGNVTHSPLPRPPKKNLSHTHRNLPIASVLRAYWVSKYFKMSERLCPALFYSNNKLLWAVRQRPTIFVQFSGNLNCLYSMVTRRENK